MKNCAVRNTSILLLSLIIDASSLVCAQETVTVKLGAAAPLTGGVAHQGRDSENGAKLAVEEINAKGLVVGGKKVVLDLLQEDDAQDPRTATQIAQMLVDEKVVAVIGHQSSGTSIAASQIYRDAGIIEISPSATNPAYTQQGFKTTYRMIGTDAQQGPALAEYAAKHMGAKTMAIIDDATAYGQGLADQVAKSAKIHDIKVVSRDASTDKTLDFRGILTKIKGENPDVIMYGGSDASGMLMVKQAAQLGLRAKILSGDGMCMETMGESTGDASKNLTCSEAGLPLDMMPGGKEFKRKFEEKFKQPILSYAPFAYDAVYVVVDAMKRARSTDPAKILAEMPSTQYSGVIGNISFFPNGDLKQTSISIYTFKDKKKTLVDVLKM
ncbi:branched-chain amino acid ABC transporter substrate-binding protein [Paraburkholderia sp. HD33-4]|uniref:branched-chain amino acid ABC transporter substrate-binding protein n=1 Tax=Paraburkholderia sp. HD33-4 TaxID=2883242 RepID=UPI001F239484|nr:branched-chain amino acid ABC transporter substrate-binding protein [Paraburkholderia sp. HD33-4]